MLNFLLFLPSYLLFKIYLKLNGMELKVNYINGTTFLLMHDKFDDPVKKEYVIRKMHKLQMCPCICKNDTSNFQTYTVCSDCDKIFGNHKDGGICFWIPMEGYSRTKCVCDGCYEAKKAEYSKYQLLF